MSDDINKELRHKVANIIMLLNFGDKNDRVIRELHLLLLILDLNDDYVIKNITNLEILKDKLKFFLVSENNTSISFSLPVEILDKFTSILKGKSITHTIKKSIITINK